MVPSSSSAAFSSLERAFYRYLTETNLYPGLETIRASAVQGGLLLAAEHNSSESSEPGKLLVSLELAFREIMTEVGIPEESDLDWRRVSVQISLQTSDRRPYAIHTFTWSLEEIASAVFNGPNGNEANKHVPNKPPQAKTEKSRIDSTEKGASPSAFSPSDGISGSEIAPFDDTLTALPATTVAKPQGWKTVQRWGQSGLRRLLSLTRFWGYGLAGIILIGSGLAAYGITRPCVVGRCDRLEKAEGFSRTAQERIRDNPSSEEITEAQSDLQAAVDLVAAIPEWSRHYERAQASLSLYQSELEAFKLLTQAQKKAQQAAQRGQDPPHPVERWVDAHQLWQQAVQRLEQVPQDVAVYEFAQLKLREYEANVKAASHRITAEEEAQSNLNFAVRIGQLATQRMATAESLASWRLAAESWQAAINGLFLIPQGTLAYPEAQEHLQDYRHQLRRTQTRIQLEQASSQQHQQAQAAARQAQTAERLNQWKTAVKHWEGAIRHIQTAPSASSLASQAQELLAEYQQALERAQGQLKIAVTLQQMRTTLGKVCQGAATLCTVAAVPSQIQITLASEHSQMLEQAITPPSADRGALALSSEMQQLLDQILELGNRIGRPVVIYDSQGRFIARYRADLGGFIRH